MKANWFGVLEVLAEAMGAFARTDEHDKKTHVEKFANFNFPSQNMRAFFDRHVKEVADNKTLTQAFVDEFIVHLKSYVS